ncbi:unnamed protein product, partial [Porites evermanni]
HVLLTILQFASVSAIAQVYNDEGSEAYDKKDYSNAVYFYTEGIKVNCKDKDLMAELYSNRAHAHLCLGNYSDSLKDAKDATDIRPSSLKAITTGANASLKMNMSEKVIAWCERGLEIDKENKTLLELRKQALTWAEKENNPLGNTVIDHKSFQKSKSKQGLDSSAFKEDGMDSYDLVIKELKRGDFRAARDYFALEFKQAKKNKERDRECTACTNLGTAYVCLGKFKKVIEFFQRALGIAEETGNKNSEGTAYLNLGSAYGSLGQFRKAIEFFERALGIAEETGNKDSEGKAYLNLGNAYRSLGQFQKPIEFFERALGIFEETGNKDAEGTAYLNLGSAYHFLGQFRKAIEFLQRALGIFEETGSKDSEGKVYLNLGNAYRSLGQPRKAIEFLQRALGIFEETGNKDAEGTAYLNLG